VTSPRISWLWVSDCGSEGLWAGLEGGSDRVLGRDDRTRCKISHDHRPPALGPAVVSVIRWRSSRGSNYAA
jgi:hypothetical protein